MTMMGIVWFPGLMVAVGALIVAYADYQKNYVCSVYPRHPLSTLSYSHKKGV